MILIKIFVLFRKLLNGINTWHINKFKHYTSFEKNIKTCSNTYILM